MSTSLYEKIARRESGICLYGIAPPKQAATPARLLDIAAKQEARLRALKIDGLIVYDIQDEADRNSDPRPFPFLPTIDPDAYAFEHLKGLKVPKIVYRCVRARSEESFDRWLQDVAKAEEARFSVLVGGASTRSARAGLELDRAYSMVQERAPNLQLGGIAIAERHTSKLTEHQRIRKKLEQGCRFFVTQAVYDASSSMSLLSDYALMLEAEALQPVPMILTFSPCGSAKTLELMKWLGISIPRWLENELRHSSDILERSIALCERVFEEVLDFAQQKRLPIGINVESISIRKSEIEASVALFEALRSKMAR